MSALILGIVQGLTELLPVSSSGHLVLVEKTLGLELNDLSFEIGVHLATALGLCFVLRNELWTMLRSILPTGLSQDARTEGRSLILKVLIGTVPAALVGLAASGQIQSMFHSVRLTLVMLPVTGAFLLSTRWAKDRTLSVSMQFALLVGIAQAIAILPGISRSGLTIGAALFLGIRKEEAVRFSFLLSLPAVAGGALLEFSEAAEAQSVVSTNALAIGSAVAFVSAVVAARTLLRVVRRGKLEYFGYYCIAVGLLGLLLVAG